MKFINNMTIPFGFTST